MTTLHRRNMTDFMSSMGAGELTVGKFLDSTLSVRIVFASGVVSPTCCASSVSSFIFSAGVFLETGNDDSFVELQKCSTVYDIHPYCFIEVILLQLIAF